MLNTQASIVRLQKSINIEVYPNDLGTPTTYLTTVKAVEALGDGWRIPTKEELLLIYENKDKISGFGGKEVGCHDWYWSSTEQHENSSLVWNIRLSDGREGWNFNSNTWLNCRPVRSI